MGMEHNVAACLFLWLLLHQTILNTVLPFFVNLILTKKKKGSKRLLCSYWPTLIGEGRKNLSEEIKSNRLVQTYSVFNHSAPVCMLQRVSHCSHVQPTPPSPSPACTSQCPPATASSAWGGCTSCSQEALLLTVPKYVTQWAAFERPTRNAGPPGETQTHPQVWFWRLRQDLHEELASEGTSPDTHRWVWPSFCAVSGMISASFVLKVLPKCLKKTKPFVADRGEAVYLQLGRMLMALCSLWWADASLSQAHRRQTIQVPSLWESLFPLRPPLTPHEETLRDLKSVLWSVVPVQVLYFGIRHSAKEVNRLPWVVAFASLFQMWLFVWLVSALCCVLTVPPTLALYCPGPALAYHWGVEVATTRGAELSLRAVSTSCDVIFSLLFCCQPGYNSLVLRLDLSSTRGQLLVSNLSSTRRGQSALLDWNIVLMLHHYDGFLGSIAAAKPTVVIAIEQCLGWSFKLVIWLWVYWPRFFWYFLSVVCLH